VTIKKVIYQRRALLRPMCIVKEVIMLTNEQQREVNRRVKEYEYAMRKAFRFPPDIIHAWAQRYKIMAMQQIQNEHR
jgi:hypothetical protein